MSESELAHQCSHCERIETLPLESNSDSDSEGKERFKFCSACKRSYYVSSSCGAKGMKLVEVVVGVNLYRARMNTDRTPTLFAFLPLFKMIVFARGNFFCQSSHLAPASSYKLIDFTSLPTSNQKKNSVKPATGSSTTKLSVNCSRQVNSRW